MEQIIHLYNVVFFQIGFVSAKIIPCAQLDYFQQFIDFW